MRLMSMSGKEVGLWESYLHERSLHFTSSKTTS